MHLEVSLSESDINDVKVGQQATVTVNAASGEEVAGKVVSIDVLSSSSSSSGTSSGSPIR
jgi:multidrug resistance efflux pump